MVSHTFILRAIIQDILIDFVGKRDLKFYILVLGEVENI